MIPILNIAKYLELVERVPLGPGGGGPPGFPFDDAQKLDFFDHDLENHLSLVSGALLDVTDHSQPDAFAGRARTPAQPVGARCSRAAP
jgi:hypothetical protein